jgi:hypothetical protein
MHAAREPALATSKIKEPTVDFLLALFTTMGKRWIW